MNVPLQKNEARMLQSGDMAGVLYRRLTSSKFRKSALDVGTAKFFQDYLSRAVEAGERIKLLFLFGGYKQARLSAAPYPDWAEVFTVSFAMEAAAAVAGIYEPGVEVIYRGDEVVVTLLDNYKKAARAAYGERFRKILDVYRNHLPDGSNISLRYELTAETSPEPKLFAAMKKLYPKYEARFETLPRDVQEQRISKSYRNQCWDGEEDLTGLSEAEKHKRARWAFIMHDAFLKADVEMARKYFADGISITYRRGVPGCMHYGSCSSSAVQFWAGEGFVNVRAGRMVPWILSHDQEQDITSREEVLGRGNVFAEAGLGSLRLLDDYQD